jgi:hypothetical protein
MYLALDGAVGRVEVWYSLLESGAVLQAVLAPREGVAQCLRLVTNALLFSGSSVLAARTFKKMALSIISHRKRKKTSK